MRCVICRTGTTEAGIATLTVDREGRICVLRDVPALVCQQCSEPFFEAHVTKQVLDQVDQAARSGVEVAVLKFNAA